MTFSSFLHDLAKKAEGRVLDEPVVRDLGHELDRHAADHPDGVAGFFARLGTWAKEHPVTILNFLRLVRPVLQVKNICIVTSHSGCRHVLGDHEDYAVIYADKMKMITEGDNFFLGMDDDEPAGMTARSAMALVFRREDIGAVVAPAIEALAQETIARCGPRFDAVADYLKVVPARFAIKYFGFSAQVDPKWLLETTQTLFEYLFIDVENDPETAKKATVAAAELRAMLEREIASGGDRSASDSVLARALKLSASGHPAFTARAIRNDFIGLLIGLAPTTAKSAAMAYDLLTQDQEKTERAARAAAGAFADFQALVREATRLNPINPGLFRKARRDTVLLSDGHETKIAKDTLVFVGTAAGMRDPRHVPDPLSLQPGCPEAAYLTYGHGLHACFGRYINDLHIASLLRTLFASGARRADGADGDLQFEGPFPHRLSLQR